MNGEPRNSDVRGDDRPMPDQGTGTGVSDTYGADIGSTSANGEGRISGAGSDPIDRVKSPDPRS